MNNATKPPHFYKISDFQQKTVANLSHKLSHEPGNPHGYWVLFIHSVIGVR